MEKKFDVIILAGGKGTRLRKVLKGRPKPLVNLNKNIYFLDLLLIQLDNLKVGNIYLSIFSKHENFFQNYLKLRNYRNVILIKEKSRLGTGGAIKNITEKTNITNNFLCFNGDTYTDLSLVFKKIIKLKYYYNYIFLSNSYKKEQTGNVIVKNNNIISFDEKIKIPKSLSSMGIYFLKKKDIYKVKKKFFSIEKFYFKLLIQNKVLKPVYIKNIFYDVGTYNSLTKFKKKFKASKQKVLFICRKNDFYSLKMINFLKKFNISLKIIYSKFMGEKINSPYFNYTYDYIFSYRSYFILKPNHLSKSKISINFHPSTPDYRGSGGINYALFNKDKRFGITTHIMNKILDNGPILHTKYFKISKNDNLKILLAKTHRILFHEAKKIINLIFKDKIELIELAILNKKKKWSKKINNIKKLNNLYKIPHQATTKKINLIIKSTLIDRYKPYKIIKKKKFFYE